MHQRVIESTQIESNQDGVAPVCCVRGFFADACGGPGVGKHCEYSSEGQDCRLPDGGRQQIAPSSGRSAARGRPAQVLFAGVVFLRLDDDVLARAVVWIAARTEILVDGQLINFLQFGMTYLHVTAVGVDLYRCFACNFRLSCLLCVHRLVSINQLLALFNSEPLEL